MPVDKLSVFEARAQFSELVHHAEQGKQTAITRDGKIVARIVPAKRPRSEQWDRSEAVDRIIKFSRSCRTRRKVRLKNLIQEGRL